MATEWKYLPILKWKQGEQLALRNLTETQWSGVVPLLELQPIQASPDSASIRANLPAYLNDKVTSKLCKAVPPGWTVAIDTSSLSVGTVNQLLLLILTCTQLQRMLPDYTFVPVIHASQLESLNLLSISDKERLNSFPEIMLRIIIDQFEPFQVSPSVSKLTSYGIKKKNLHILIDQYSIVERDPNECFKNVKPYADNAIGTKCASVTIAGGAFPVNLMGRRGGLSTIPRVEWKTWCLFRKSGEYSTLRYSDYTVTNPAPLEVEIDPSKLNPSIAIRYAVTETWRLYKGSQFKKAPKNEYKTLCKFLVSDAHYSGENFSYGDRQYKLASETAKETNGTPSSWRKEATNHHIVLTASSL